MGTSPKLLAVFRLLGSYFRGWVRQIEETQGLVHDLPNTGEPVNAFCL